MLQDYGLLLLQKTKYGESIESQVNEGVFISNSGQNGPKKFEQAIGQKSLFSTTADSPYRK